ncbi:MAG: aminodeoxychorismate synthase component I [Gammaproteobacteria bacterium]
MPYPRIEEIDYERDTGARFAGLAHLPGSVFLDSGGFGGGRGRYDVFAAKPYLTLTSRGLHTEIRSRSGTRVSGAHPFRLLKEALLPDQPAVSTLPFAGGAIGYFAYDLARRLERLPSLAAADLDLPDLCIGLYDWAVVADHATRQSHLVCAGRDERSLDNWEPIRALVLGGAAPAPRRPFRVLSAVVSNMDHGDYRRAFDRIKRYIRDGDCYQVNLAQRFSAPAEGDAWNAYRTLQELNPAPFSAYLRLPEGAVLSTSPERFLEVRGGRVETRPIKGTRPRSRNKVRDHVLALELSASAKDIAENLMIVDLLRNDLGKTCALGSIEVPALFELESFETVHHLVSTVTGRLAPGRHSLDLLEGCFPGGSITGAPKLRAMQIIEELEPHRRGVYCGAIGYIGFDGAMDLNIAIRTLVYQGGWIHAWAGGGIVMDSDPEAEYQETLDKAQALLRLLSYVGRSHVGG